jgi:regulator of protease activity HflC (stomatin/prohibitin superfamily)
MMGIQEIISGIATLAWLGAIGALGYVVFSAARGRRFGGSAAIVVGITILAAVLTTIAAGVVFIEPNERGVVISALSPKGYRDEALQPGLRWVIPFAERVQKYKIQRETYTMSATSGEGQQAGDDAIRARTKDGQEVFVDASVIYSIDPDKIIPLHITWQDRYQDNVVRPLSRGIIRDAASQYGVEEIVSSKRAELEQLVTDEMTKKLGENSLILVDFVVRNVAFTEQYAQAVEQKQIAEQQAQQARFVVEQRKQEAEQARQVAQGQADAAVISARAQAEARIIQAQAEAQALKLVSDALRNNPDLLTYQYIQKIAPGVQTIYLPSNQPFLIPLPQSGGSSSSSTVLPTPTTTVTTTTP